MINIFNLFLFLLACWVLFMLSFGTFSVSYVCFGLLSCTLVAVVSAKIGLIEKNSELLYLSFGFYRHFFGVFMRNFYRSILLVISLAFGGKKFQPTLCKATIKKKFDFNPALLIATVNMTCGLLCIETKDDNSEFVIHAIDEKFFDGFDLQKTCLSLEETNDDKLV